MTDRQKILTPAQLRQFWHEREAQHAAQDNRIDRAAARLVQPQDVARVMALVPFRGKR